MCNQVLSGKKFVIVSAILVLLSGFGLEVYSQDLDWNFQNIPEKWKFDLEVSNPNSSKETVLIGGYFYTKRVYEKAYDTNWENLSEDFRARIRKDFEEYGPDTLYLEVIQGSSKPFTFDLHKFAFTQSQNQYAYHRHFTIEPLNSTLRIATYTDIGYPMVHSLRPGVRAFGIISTPANINLSKPFTIWYGEYSAELNAEGLDIKEQANN